MISSYKLLVHQPRIQLWVSLLIYAYILNYAHSTYLLPVWEYFYFSYSPLDPAAIILLFSLISICAIWSPIKIDSPSAIVLLLLTIVVYVPTVTITVGLKTLSKNQHIPLLIAFAGAYALVCRLTARRQLDAKHRTQLPSRSFERFFLGGWIFCTVALVASYGSIMQFSGLEDIYLQRTASSDGNVFMAYIKSYYSAVFSPTMIALGIVKRKHYYTLLGLAGCVIMYMITAQRTIFLLPIFMIGLNQALNSKLKFLHSPAFPILLISASVFWVVYYYEDSPIAFLVAADLVVRSLAIPGSMLTKYSQLFDQGGYTWWSHVKGINFLVDPPALFAKHPSWPSLGYLVGDYYHDNPAVNENANLFASDGVAAAGAFGVFVISLVFSAWLRLADKISARWNPKFTVLIFFPIANDLTNGPLFTTLLSFGGIFWLLVSDFFISPDKSSLSKLPSAARQPTTSRSPATLVRSPDAKPPNA